MGFTEADYQKVAPNARFVSHEEVYQKQIVLVLRCPSNDDLKFMQPDACLISMLHYPTRPQRVNFLKSLGIEAISLDSLKDETGRRLVENLRAVAWNGLEVGFQMLHRTYPSPGLESSKRGPVHATVLGIGAVGMHAVQAASRYGDMRLWQALAERGVPGVQVTAVDYDLAGHESTMKAILARTDVLIDATQRPDPSKVIIPNEWVGILPEHAIQVDLSVDPYNCAVDPPEVKGIEGMPQGNLDQYVFMPDDPVYERIPGCIPTKHRRHAVSCYSWPGIHPKACMTLYGDQIRPIMRTIIDRNGVQNINHQGRYFERAIGRALLSRWESSETNLPTSKPEKEDKG
jgi:alanine dehydrogenase